MPPYRSKSTKTPGGRCLQAAEESPPAANGSLLPLGTIEQGGGGGFVGMRLAAKSVTEGALAQRCALCQRATAELRCCYMETTAEKPSFSSSAQGGGTDS
ncbi:hypothetical protein JOQ06_007448, partial [Pogonophryne albipinna]